MSFANIFVLQDFGMLEYKVFQSYYKNSGNAKARDDLLVVFV